MGLLDSIDDPQTLGLLSMGLRLMSTPGKFGQAFGSAGMGALGDVQQARQQQEQRQARKTAQEQATQAHQLQQQLGQQQLLQAQQQAEQQAKQRAFLANLQNPAQAALNGGGGPTQANAAKFDPLQELMFNGVKQGVIPLQTYLASLQKDETPIALTEGGKLFTKGGRELASNPKAPDLPSAVREYQYAQQQGYKGSLLEYTLAQKKAGANSVSVNVPVNTTKTLMQSMAEKLGGQIDDNFGAAKSAVSAIEGAQKVRNLLATGKIVTGPGADLRVNLRQVADALGVGGKDNSEVLANTRQTIQQLAQFELDAGSQMKGQGAVTESERAILRKAAAGDINFTSPELGALTQTIEGRARKRIASHRDNVQRLGKLPGGEVIAPLYQVNEPGAGSIDDLVNKWTR